MLGKFRAKYGTCMTDESGGVVLTFVAQGEDAAEARKCAAAARTAREKGKERLTLEVDTYKEKRSLSANAYLWILCTKIASILKTTKDEVYRTYIRRQGIYKQLEISNNAVETFLTAWGMHGVGWIAEKVDEARREGFSLIHAYYGSSVYNKAQMCRLLDSIIEDCKEIGIETITPEEKDALTSLWEPKA